MNLSFCKANGHVDVNSNAEVNTEVNVNTDVNESAVPESCCAQWQYIVIIVQLTPVM